MVVLPDKLLVKVMVLSMVATTGFSRVKREEDAQQSYPEGENEIEPLIIDRGPYFDKSVSKNVTALVGKTAYLGCRIRNLGNRTVSWIRHRDLHLLTVNRFTYTSDQRFSARHNPQTEDWTLQVRYPQKRDAGVYECQVGTTPPIGISMYLSVVEPVTTLLGGPEMYIHKWSTMNLTCIIKHSPEPPPSIYWTHDQQFPNTENEWMEFGKVFEQRWNFPNCGGAIDRKHIRIKCPPKSGSYYYNYKHFLVSY
ncbi:uncharacterized protein LOC126736543 isoform X2 [Anthonomus grandis grandis]|uniref:uncharacterized protein LOC126736543 isoform X2 n=1 Tax=Anthonomus grandis grandis TaxID=2921223 RepID=UPI0021660634|nr:uncharacterized protein LOC126736543 isoform X2 [Anthonomus grandis grandis]